MKRLILAASIVLLLPACSISSRSVEVSAQPSPALTAPSPSFLQQAAKVALQAAVLTQIAKSEPQWRQVVNGWQQAIF